MSQNNINLTYSIGQVVYLKNDPEQFGRYVTGFLITVDAVKYMLSFMGDETFHYDFELSPERTITTILN